MPTPARELVLVRHGQSTYNAAHLFAGQCDPPLTETGLAQAAALARGCADLRLDTVACSDLRRATQTAEVVTEHLGLPAPRRLPDLRERWSRTLAGMTQDQIESAHPGVLAAWRDGHGTELPGDSEPYAQFHERVARGLLTAAALAPVVLVVAHAGLFRVLDSLCSTRLGAGVANAGGRRVTVADGRFSWAGDAFPSPGGAPTTGRGEL